jgi:hypothetical protein
MEYAPKEQVLTHLRRLLKWNPEILTPHLGGLMDVPEARELAQQVLERPEGLDQEHAIRLEAVVLDHGRPVLFIRNNTFVPSPDTEWQGRLEQSRTVIQQQLAAVGRIELRVQGFRSGQEIHVGTGFMIGPRVLLTNRHVAEVFCHADGTILPWYSPRVDFVEEFERDPDQECRIIRALTIGRSLDFALFEVAAASGTPLPEPLTFARQKPAALQDGEHGTLIFIVGYPAMDRNLPPRLQARIFEGIFGVKRLAPGRLREIQAGFAADSQTQEIQLVSDYTSLGGNSGSPVCDLDTGQVLGLHYAGAYLQANYAVPIWSLTAHITHAIDATRTPRAFGMLSPATASSRMPEGLSVDAVQHLQECLRNAPDDTLAYFRSVWDGELSLGDLHSALHMLRATAEHAGGTATEAAIEAAFQDVRPEAVWPPAHWGMGEITLPGDFSFPDMTETIPIEPPSYKFETKRDAAGWVHHTAQAFLANELGLLPKTRFRWAEDSASHFVYLMGEPRTSDSQVRIGLFSDFGTGLYHSRYIAWHMARWEPRLDYAIHLGDVYYKGTAEEFTAHFTQPLQALLQHTPLFALNANHEMLSGGMAYFQAMDARRTAANGPARHVQEGSYFCLRSKTDQYQIIGLDTAYHARGRHSERRLNDWLAVQLERKRTHGTITILLSGDQPYDVKSGEQTDLLSKDLHAFVEAGLIDLWFWGNEHYCALYRRTPATPFIGSCIGHGGYPYSRMDRGDVAASLRSQLQFLESAPRFPEATGVRPDRGNNGFAVLTLTHDGSIELAYVDWMRHERFRTTLRQHTTAAGMNFLD